MEEFYKLIGNGQFELEWWQMCARALIVFFITLAMVRMGATRIFGRNSVFDIVLGIILGSILSRAITGNSAFFPTIAAAFVLIALHILLAYLSLKLPWMGWFIKGKENCLIKDGQLLEDQMAKCHITKNDLMESLRIKGQDDLDQIKSAFLERSGEISIIFKEKSR